MAIQNWNWPMYRLLSDSNRSAVRPKVRPAPTRYYHRLLIGKRPVVHGRRPRRLTDHRDPEWRRPKNAKLPPKRQHRSTVNPRQKEQKRKEKESKQREKGKRSLVFKTVIVHSSSKENKGKEVAPGRPGRSIARLSPPFDKQLSLFSLFSLIILFY